MYPHPLYSYIFLPMAVVLRPAPPAVDAAGLAGGKATGTATPVEFPVVTATRVVSTVVDSTAVTDTSPVHSCRLYKTHIH